MEGHTPVGAGVEGGHTLEGVGVKEGHTPVGAEVEGGHILAGAGVEEGHTLVGVGVEGGRDLPQEVKEAVGVEEGPLTLA